MRCTGMHLDILGWVALGCPIKELRQQQALRGCTQMHRDALGCAGMDGAGDHLRSIRELRQYRALSGMHWAECCWGHSPPTKELRQGESPWESPMKCKAAVRPGPTPEFVATHSCCGSAQGQAGLHYLFSSLYGLRKHPGAEHSPPPPTACSLRGFPEPCSQLEPWRCHMSPRGGDSPVPVCTPGLCVCLRIRLI